jgi:hypothetical protein
MHEERTGRRPSDYSSWHRRASTMRYVGIERAQLLHMIDLDGALFVEYDGDTKKPLALIETARDIGQPYKCATVTANLARRARLPCYCVLYTCADSANPADTQARDICAFRVRRLWPRPERSWRTLTPGDWATGLLQIRRWSAERLDVEAANDPEFRLE